MLIRELAALLCGPRPRMTSRRFPPLWSAEVQPNYYVVRDANKQQLAYVYYENEPGRRCARKTLSKSISEN
jgi:hypothetical protein